MTLFSLALAPCSLMLLPSMAPTQHSAHLRSAARVIMAENFPSSPTESAVASDKGARAAECPASLASDAPRSSHPSVRLGLAGLTGTLITYASVSAEMRNLIDEAFTQRNRERLLSDKPPYTSLEAMVDAYVEHGAKQGWTREDAESEVVRFLQRRALSNEGGFTGSAQDYAAQAMLVLLLGSLGYQTTTGGGLAAWENPFF